MKEMTKFVLLTVPLGILVAGSWLFILPYYAYQDAMDRVPGVIILGTLWAAGVTVVSAFIVMRQYSTIRLGLRLSDERSREIVLKAGYYSFWISVGWWSLLNFVILSDSNAFGLLSLYQAPEALVGGLMALPVIFFTVWFYLTYKYRPGQGGVVED